MAEARQTDGPIKQFCNWLFTLAFAQNRNGKARSSNEKAPAFRQGLSHFTQA